MLTSVQGVFQNGKVELTEPVPEGISGRVIVTFSARIETSLAQRTWH